jgi:hypothetical protein
MSTNSATNSDGMIQDALLALKSVHGFTKESEVYSTRNEMSFAGDKPTIASYSAARVNIALRRQHSRWILSNFMVRPIYMTGQVDDARDPEMKALKLLTAQGFLDFALCRSKGKHWTVKNGWELIELFRRYDEAARVLGFHSPLFLIT